MANQNQNVKNQDIVGSIQEDTSSQDPDLEVWVHLFLQQFLLFLVLALGGLEIGDFLSEVIM